MRKILIGLIIVTLLLGCMQLSAEQVAKQMEEKYKSIKDMKGKMVVTTDFGKGKKEVYSVSFTMKMPKN